MGTDKLVEKLYGTHAQTQQKLKAERERQEQMANALVKTVHPDPHRTQEHVEHMMAAHKKKVDDLEQHRKEKEKEEAGLIQDPEINERSKEMAQQSRPIWERMEFIMSARKDKHENACKAREHEEVEGATFRPQLTSQAEAVGDRGPTRQEAWEKHRKEKLEEDRKQRAHEELKGCTFHPEVRPTSSAKHGKTAAGPRYERLHQDAVRRQGASASANGGTLQRSVTPPAGTGAGARAAPASAPGGPAAATANGRPLTPQGARGRSVTPTPANGGKSQRGGPPPETVAAAAPPAADATQRSSLITFAADGIWAGERPGANTSAGPDFDEMLRGAVGFGSEVDIGGANRQEATVRVNFQDEGETELRTPVGRTSRVAWPTKDTSPRRTLTQAWEQAPQAPSLCTLKKGLNVVEHSGEFQDVLKVVAMHVH